MTKSLRIKIYALCVLILTLSSCATIKMSPFVEQALKPDSRKASICIYRSSKEPWLNKYHFVAIYIDGNPFSKIKTGENFKIFLNQGIHLIEAEFIDNGNLTTPKVRENFFCESGKSYYLRICSKTEGVDWYMTSPFQLIPLPVPGRRIYINKVTEEHALSEIGDTSLEIEKRLIK